MILALLDFMYHSWICDYAFCLCINHNALGEIYFLKLKMHNMMLVVLMLHIYCHVGSSVIAESNSEFSRCVCTQWTGML